ncbi:MAG: Maf family protein [Kiritimatiellia bacterium]
MTTRQTSLDLVLASQSPRRRKLLAELGLPFRCATPAVEELSTGLAPRALVLHNALIKWRWCCTHEPDALILAADTTVELDGEVLGKPSDRREAEAMLRRQSGRVQAVHTGYVLAYAHEGDPPAACGVETSRVLFRELTEDAIRAYIDRVQPYDRAGAYDIDESGDLLVHSFDGSRTNVMGLPMERIRELLACRQ